MVRIRENQGRGGRVFLLPGLITTQEETAEGNHSKMKTQHMLNYAESHPAGRSFLVGICDQDRLILLLKDVLTSCNHDSHGLARGSNLVEICLVSMKSVPSLSLTSLRPPSRQDT